MIIYQCDVCKKTCNMTDINEMMEAQEFFKIRHSCGYLSVFGDLNHLDLDICQHCFKKMLEKAKVKTNEFCFPIEDIYKFED